MTVNELLKLLSRSPESEVIIYNDGNFIIEDAWFDRAKGVFAIQVQAEEEEPKEPKGEEERRGSAKVRFEREMKDSGRW